jgi:hypothetical protein
MLFAVTVAAAVSCAHQQTRPDWVNGVANATYPRRDFMTGVGSGDSLESAQDRARAEIAKQFTVRIEQNLQDQQVYSGTDTDRGSSWVTKNDIRELTRTITGETIAGLEIRETWNDPKTGLVHALAVLPRAPAIRMLEARTSELEMDINSRFKNAASQTDKIARIRLLIQATDLMKELQIKSNQLLVLSGGRSQLPPKVTSADLDRELRETLKSLRCAVRITGSAADRVREAIVQSLTLGGISVGSEADDLLVTGSVNGTETDEGNTTGYVFFKMRGSIELVNGRDGGVISRMEPEWRDGARNIADAKEKVVSKLTEQIISDFNARLHEYLSR